MADIIDYGQVKNAAKDANVDVKAELNRVGGDIQNLSQQVTDQGNRLNDLQTRVGPITNLQQQLATIEMKVDQLTNQLQNILARLP